MTLEILFLAALNACAAGYLALTARKVWKYLSTGMRVLDVAIVALNVALCVVNLVRALS